MAGLSDKEDKEATLVIFNLSNLNILSVNNFKKTKRSLPGAEKTLSANRFCGGKQEIFSIVVSRKSKEKASRELPFVARAWAGWGKGDYRKYNSSAKKFEGEARKRAGKKKRGCGGNEFLPVCYRAEGAVRVGSGSACAFSAGQNPQKFSTLIEKFFARPP